MIYESFYSSPVGLLCLKCDDCHLLSLRRQTAADGTPDFKPCQSEALELTTRWLDVYFEGKNPDFLPPLKLQGTPFQQQVWDILLRIPYGSTTTYGAIAKIIAQQRGLPKMSAQAVGLAVGANPVGIIVPCHRVIGCHNSLTGYAGGLKMKKMLLALEGIDVDAFSIPRHSRFYDFDD